MLRSSWCATLFSTLGMDVHSGLAITLGAEIDDGGYVLSDGHQQIRVPGLLVAGDVARGLNQISVAISEAAVAASAMHLWLARR
jgi:thioredoxin reductase (NADPH)